MKLTPGKVSLNGKTFSMNLPVETSVDEYSYFILTEAIPTYLRKCQRPRLANFALKWLCLEMVCCTVNKLGRTEPRVTTARDILMRALSSEQSLGWCGAFDGTELKKTGNCKMANPFFIDVIFSDA